MLFDKTTGPTRPAAVATRLPAVTFVGPLNVLLPIRLSVPGPTLVKAPLVPPEMEPLKAALPPVVSMVPPPAATTTGRLELNGTVGWNVPPLNCKVAPLGPVAQGGVAGHREDALVDRRAALLGIVAREGHRAGADLHSHDAPLPEMAPEKVVEFASPTVNVPPPRRTWWPNVLPGTASSNSATCWLAPLRSKVVFEDMVTTVVVGRGFAPPPPPSHLAGAGPVPACFAGSC